MTDKHPDTESGIAGFHESLAMMADGGQSIFFGQGLECLIFKEARGNVYRPGH